MNEPDTFPEWDRSPRAPEPLPPAGSCDCQFHIYGDREKYPPDEDAYYDPPDATFWHMKDVLKAIGFQRGIIVFPMTYGTDHSLLFDVLEAIRDTGDAKNFRATCVVKDDVTDAEMDRLNALGVVGARFNIGKRWHEKNSPDAIKRNLERVREIGGSVKSAGTRACMSAAAT